MLTIASLHPLSTVLILCVECEGGGVGCENEARPSILRTHERNRSEQ